MLWCVCGGDLFLFFGLCGFLRGVVMGFVWIVGNCKLDVYGFVVFDMLWCKGNFDDLGLEWVLFFFVFEELKDIIEVSGLVSLCLGLGIDKGVRLLRILVDVMCIVVVVREYEGRESLLVFNVRLFGLLWIFFSL